MAHPVRGSDSPLDDALLRVSGLEFPGPGPYVNHGPMAAEALSVLDLEAVLPHWVERWEAELVEAPGPAVPPWGPDPDWRTLIGRRRLLPEWQGFFDRSIENAGWRRTVEVWVPRFMPALNAALYHGVIRTAHAVRSLERAETLARRAELARALGLWATRCKPGQPTPAAAISDPAGVMMEAAARGARCYVAHPSLFNLHGVTGALAVHLLTGYLSSAEAANAAAQLRLDHRTLYAGTEEVRTSGPEGWDESVEAAAAASFDAHQVKLVEACLRGYRTTGDRAFSDAARVRLSPGLLK